MQTNNRGGIATSSSRSESQLPKLKRQPVRKTEKTSYTGKEKDLDGESQQDDVIAWLEERIIDTANTPDLKPRARRKVELSQLKAFSFWYS